MASLRGCGQFVLCGSVCWRHFNFTHCVTMSLCAVRLECEMCSLCSQGILEGFDVLAVPGGKSVEQSKSLGVAGRSAVCHFVARGGGYLGN